MSNDKYGDSLVLRVIWPSSSVGLLECAIEVFGAKSTYAMFKSDMCDIHGVFGNWVLERCGLLFVDDIFDNCTLETLNIQDGDTLSLYNIKTIKFLKKDIANPVNLEDLNK